MAGASCPFCGYEAKTEYDILYHMEDLHAEGNSPFIPTDAQPVDAPQEEYLSRVSQAMEDIGYVECPISECGETVPLGDLDSHLELHSLEDSDKDSHVDNAAWKWEGATEPADSKFDTSLPIALRNLGESSGSLLSATDRQAKAKESWRGILNMPKSIVVPQASPKSKSGKGRLGTAELGPYAYEEKMPAWLHNLLLSDGMPRTTTKLNSSGGITTVKKIGNHVSGVMPVLEKLIEQDPDTEYAYTCHPSVEHVSKLKNEGAFCGYRNIQMLASYIINNRSQGYYHFKDKMPSIFQIQEFIEHAWDVGINSVGRVETGGIVGTRKYIGTPEAQAMLRSLDIDCDAQAFKTDGKLTADELLIKTVEEYFRAGCADSTSKIRTTQLPSIYFQHPGHSMTIVGLEKKLDGSINLLVFDPMFHDAPDVIKHIGKMSFSVKNPAEYLRAYRRNMKYLRKYRAFEVLSQLNFITGNKHKLAEVQAILGDAVDLQSRSIDLVEIQGTIEEISKDKCRRAAEQVQGPVLVEDTALIFNAFQNLPGPYIKWFFESLGHDGLNKLLAGFEDKTAQSVCTFAYSEGPGHEPIIFQGRTDGKIVPARGAIAFGWDPIFEYGPAGQTYAEMPKAEKNKISHRGKALDKLKAWLLEAVDNKA
ncbi:hypothetical protein V493_04163 [Pseudogymnoascus sp. VKM F-4281 (FW-2241)]|nr:hypothetical protein V493_04163 [Pseudogymnoascus sp. VKM F-4281 (FW-2241)]